MNRWKTIYRLAVCLIVVAACVAAAAIFLPQCNKLRNLQTTKTQSEQDIRELEKGTKDLRSKQERFASDPDYAIKTARDMGMVKPTETIFEVTNRQSTATRDRR
jgi:cell division protein FtsB